MEMEHFLEEGLNDLAVIRNTLEARAYFAENAPVRAELAAIIAEARGNLLKSIESWQTKAIFADYDRIRTLILDLIRTPVEDLLLLYLKFRQDTTSEQEEFV